MKFKPWVEEILDVEQYSEEWDELVEKHSDDICVKSDGFWYNLTMGGYISFDQYVDDPETLKRLNDALDLLLEFQEAYDHLAGDC